MSTQQTFDFSVDLLRAILWHYNRAENLENLLQRKNDFYNERQRDFWQNWIRDVFDLRTANDFGLSVWAIILDIPLYTESEASPNTYAAFGFLAGGPASNFARSNFATSPGEFNRLNTEQRRLLLRLRYYQLTTTASVPEINRILAELFNNNAYVLDGNDMSMRYVFTRIPDNNVLFVLQQFDILPRPSSVSLTTIITPFRAWGFGAPHQNFGRGNFFGN